jgi:hypothetical protein
VTATGVYGSGARDPVGCVRRGTREDVRGRHRLREVISGYVDEDVFISPDQEHTVRDSIPPGLEQWALAVIET